MKVITSKKLESLSYFSEEYKNIRILEEDRLIKILRVEEDIRTVLRQSKKHIDHVILPEDVYRIVPKLNHCFQYAYTMKRVEGYLDMFSFCQFEKEFSNREILVFFKNLLTTLQKIHEQEIYSGDIFAANILLNETLEYYFLDFTIRDYPLFVENYAPCFRHQLFDEECVLLQVSDKMSLLLLILYLLKDGELPNERRLAPITEIDSLRLPDDKITKKWTGLMDCQFLPDPDDYFLEEIDTLIAKQYTLPYRK